LPRHGADGATLTKWSCSWNWKIRGLVLEALT